MKTKTYETDRSAVVPARAIDWKAAVLAGLIAGVVFVMLEMIMVAAFQGESPWAPPRMMAAMTLGEGVLKPPTFDIGIVMTAMMIHIPLSIVYGLVLGALLRRANRMTGLMVGAAFGLVIYLVNFYPIADAMFPWFAMARGWISAFAHIVFGAVAGLAYVGLRRT